MKKEELPDIPQKPGVYQYKNSAEEIIYIGKAKQLRARVASYFTGVRTRKTLRLIHEAKTLTYIVTRNETEALILENTLINEHKPKYNIQLRENKRYSYITITQELFPRVFSTRNKRQKGEYYGPYTDAKKRYAILQAIHKAFKLRTCKTLPKTVCLQYYIGNCTGPCEGHETKEEYNKKIAYVREILRGKTSAIREKLTQEMLHASAQERYEEAARLRDSIHALETLKEKQTIIQETTHDQHVISYVKDQEEAHIAIIHVRSGIIRKKEEYTTAWQEELLDEFIREYYNVTTPPKEIILPPIEYAEAFMQAQKQQGRTVQLTHPQKGIKKELLELATQNALQIRIPKELETLQQLLHLSTPPYKIDCFDISNHGDEHIVAACVRYEQAKPQPNKYRTFIIRGQTGADDYQAMQEAVKRRYAQEDPPELIVIDGGKGQLTAAQEGLRIHGHNTPIISLAKQEEEIYVPGRTRPLQTNKNSPELLLLRKIRDATHRQAISFHRKRKRHSMTESALDHIPGIGEQRKQLLYKRFKTYQGILEATKEELQELLGEKTGQHVYTRLRLE